MRRLSILLLLCGVLGSGCASDSDSEVAADLATSGDETDAVAAAPTSSMPAEQPGTGHVVSYAAAADGMSLTVEYLHGIAPCTTFGEMVVEETTDQVALTVVTTERDYPDGSVCPDEATNGTTKVALVEPLGARTVTDRSNAAVVPAK
jgi:hypothetical protein